MFKNKTAIVHVNVMSLILLDYGENLEPELPLNSCAFMGLTFWQSKLGEQLVNKSIKFHLAVCTLAPSNGDH